MDITDIIKQARAGTLKRKKAKAAGWQKGEYTANIHAVKGRSDVYNVYVSAPFELVDKNVKFCIIGKDRRAMQDKQTALIVYSVDAGRTGRTFNKQSNTGITIGCMLEIAIADTPKEIRSKLQTLAKKQRKVKLELDVERYSQDVFVLRLPASKPIKEQQLTLLDK